MNKKNSQKKSGEAFHIRYRNLFVGIFLIVPMIAIPVFLFYTMSKLSIMEKWSELHLKYATTTGLSAGNDITINGLKVGHVKSMNLDDSAYVQVNLLIKEEYMPLVKKDSRAKLKQKGFAVGDWEIALMMGSPESPPAVDGDTLEAILPVPLEKTINQITDMVETVQTILQQVADGKGTIGRILMEDSLYNEVYGITRQIHDLTSDANNTLTNFDSMLTTFAGMGKDGATLIDSVVAMAGQFNLFLGSLDTLVGNFQPLPNELDKVLGSLQKDLKETEIILKAVQQHWLLRKRVKKVLDTIPEKD